MKVWLSLVCLLIISAATNAQELSYGFMGEEGLTMTSDSHIELYEKANLKKLKPGHSIANGAQFFVAGYDDSAYLLMTTDYGLSGWVSVDDIQIQETGFWDRLLNSVMLPEAPFATAMNVPKSIVYDFEVFLESAVAAKEGLSESVEIADMYLSVIAQGERGVRDHLAEDYLNELLRELVGDWNATRIRVRVFESTAPNAYAFGDGTILISTGLLALAESRDELMGVLAHEMSHIVLKHPQIQVIVEQDIAEKEERRARRKAAATSILAGVAAGMNTANNPESASYWGWWAASVSSQAHYEYQARAVQNTAVSSAQYDRLFERQADFAATQWLRESGYDVAALGRLLSRFPESRVADTSTHDAPSHRVNNLIQGFSEGIRSPGGTISYVSVDGQFTKTDLDGTPNHDDVSHDFMLAEILSREAVSEIYNFAEYRRGLRLLERIEDVGASSAADYAWKARALRLSGAPKDAVQTALNRSIGITPIILARLEQVMFDLKYDHPSLAGSIKTLKSVLDEDELEHEDLMAWTLRLEQRASGSRLVQQ